MTVSLRWGCFKRIQYQGSWGRACPVKRPLHSERLAVDAVPQRNERADQRRRPRGGRAPPVDGPVDVGNAHRATIRSARDRAVAD
ncbi:hypothetical protein FJT64_026867 [Amphibalanus amphitrite]|uniref:Uncharacterized protein n=1 Tax=Amphibalanus amphitrite TaxID=1232801 RepID=A0A6A4W5S5_AMPAM|nr:hypothetical protein FJT64_026867 [Amphibalanus amphitrite]